MQSKKSDESLSPNGQASRSATRPFDADEASAGSSDFLAMKYDDRNIMKVGGNGDGSARVGETNGRIKGVSARRVAPVPSGKRKIRRAISFAAGLVVLIAGGLWLCQWWSVGRFIEATDDAFVGADITAIASKVPGFITRVAVADNQRVRAGDLLAVIDGRDYQAEVAKAEATVWEEEAQLANLDASAQLQAAIVDQVRAKTLSTAAERQRAQADGVRAGNLVKRNVVSVQDFEQMDATAAKARAVMMQPRPPWSQLSAKSLSSKRRSERLKKLSPRQKQLLNWLG